MEKDKLPALIPEKWLIDVIDSRLNNVNHKEHFNVGGHERINNFTKMAYILKDNERDDVLHSK